jgi:hypothetical protein
MVIKASAAAEVRTLLTHLQSPDPVLREGAVARLAVIGARAVDRLLALYPSTSDAATRLAILQALEAIGDHRAAPLARRALAEGRDIGVAAAGVLRRLLASPDEQQSADALDALVAVSLDRRADRRTRLAAFEVLQDSPAGISGPVAEALRRDPDAILSARANSTASSASASAADAIWMEALQGRLPDTAAPLHALVAERAGSAPLTVLRRLIEALRQREANSSDAPEWMAVRGSLHQALAIRESRVALYDLRETVEGSPGPLPASFLAALHSLGDASCLEPLAAAWSRAPAGAGVWRDQIEVAFRAIARRETPARRDASAKRIASRWPEAAALTVREDRPGSRRVSKPSRTRPRPRKADRTGRRSR